MLIVFRFAVQRAVTKSTNCKSGIPGFWTSRDCIAGSLSTEIVTESILDRGDRTRLFSTHGVLQGW